MLQSVLLKLDGKFIRLRHVAVWTGDDEVSRPVRPVPVQWMEVIDMIFVVMFWLRATAGAAPKATAVLAVPLPDDIGKIIPSISLTLTFPSFNRPLVTGVVFAVAAYTLFVRFSSSRIRENRKIVTGLYFTALTTLL